MLSLGEEGVELPNGRGRVRFFIFRWCDQYAIGGGKDQGSGCLNDWKGYPSQVPDSLLPRFFVSSVLRLLDSTFTWTSPDAARGSIPPRVYRYRCGMGRPGRSLGLFIFGGVTWPAEAGITPNVRINE